uniref:trefoil factor 1-like n=1 Tax=Podarcis muralis TaxID=64176 RepID=UPI00109F63EE|nr:trefoil factor 1-like [Podarcis muralis]
MNFKLLWLLAIVLVLGFASFANGQGGDEGGKGQRRNCNVPPNRRRECGYSGIPRFTCLRRGCCFNNSIRNTIWCFHAN